MTITFKSIFGTNEEKQTIEFTSKLTKSHENGIHILEFVEPSNNVQNRIEYNDEKVSIYAGPTTIDLEMGKEIKNNFETEHGTIIIVSKLKKLTIIENNEVNFEYVLNDHLGNLINNFAISLKIVD